LWARWDYLKGGARCAITLYDNLMSINKKGQNNVLLLHFLGYGHIALCPYDNLILINKKGRTMSCPYSKKFNLIST